MEVFVCLERKRLLKKALFLREPKTKRHYGDQLRERGSYSYRYDNIGNRKTARALEEEVSYNANRLNQYTDITRNTDPFIPTYDADGNQRCV